MIGRTATGFVAVEPPALDERLRIFHSPDDRHALSIDGVAERILVIRGERVLLDATLAELYGVETRVLNQAVQRNPERFPSDFMFQLDDAEVAALRSQSVISTPRRGGRRYRPHAFTEQGVAMLSSVLRSDRAVQVNVAIMRAFVGMRRLAASHGELAKRIDALESKYDRQFAVVFDAIRSLMRDDRAERRKPPIGLLTEAGIKTDKRVARKARRKS